MGQRYQEFPYIPDRFQGYMDFFSDNHQNKEPLVLEDGTSVAFPAGWTDEDADKWRKGMQLQRPINYAASTYDLGANANCAF
jgi:hypothetical protein